MTRELPSPELLRKLLRYDEDTGNLYWRRRMPHTLGEPASYCETWNQRFQGKPALSTPNKQGQLRGRINGVNLVAHRVIWAMAYGSWPEGNIKHINGDPSDNRLCNLASSDGRDSTRTLGVYKTMAEALQALADAKIENVRDAGVQAIYMVGYAIHTPVSTTSEMMEGVDPLWLAWYSTPSFNPAPSALQNQGAEDCRGSAKYA